MASLFSKVATFARSPQGQKVIAQATTKAKAMANDPATRAKIDRGAARVRSEMAKRRGGTGATGNPANLGNPGNPGGPATERPDATPR